MNRNEDLLEQDLEDLSDQDVLDLKEKSFNPWQALAILTGYFFILFVLIIVTIYFLKGI